MLQSKIFTFLAIVLAAFFAYSLLGLALPLAAVNKEIGHLNNKIVELNKSGSSLAKSDDYKKSDAYLERQARIQLNYKKADEHAVFVYKKQQQNGDGAERPKDNQETHDGLFASLKKVWQNLFSR